MVIIDAVTLFEGQWVKLLSDTKWTSDPKPADISNALKEIKSLSDLRVKMTQSASPLLKVSLSEFDLSKTLSTILATMPVLTRYVADPL